ncbi:hypothetical protein Q5P01_024785 [Channa striata]|uniref:Uncharacterized protein n=1 Tax=Channa striata TaxID=64152 RepID=A0AA88J0E3_CHASR|nr:hypothetical protein Q5P01_024785 [Channa striata]
MVVLSLFLTVCEQREQKHVRGSSGGGGRADESTSAPPRAARNFGNSGRRYIAECSHILIHIIPWTKAELSSCSRKPPYTQKNNLKTSLTSDLT